MSNYRILRLNGLYGGKDFSSYNNDLELANKSYSEQFNHIVNEGTIYSYGFIEAMNSLGNESKELLLDVEILQKTWAKENGIKFHPAKWEIEILLNQINDFKPDVVYFANRPDINLTEILKDKCPWVKLFVMFSGAHGTYENVHDADILFAGGPKIAAEYRDWGLSPILLYHSFDNIFFENQNISTNDLNYDLTFYGYVPFGLRKSTHDNRYFVISELLKRTNIELWSNEYNVATGQYENDGKKYNVSPKTINKISLKSKLRNIIVDIFFKLFDYHSLIKLKSYDLTPRKVKNIIQEILDTMKYNSNPTSAVIKKTALRYIYPSRVHMPVYGKKMYEILNQSKIVFNIHGDRIRNVVGNLRMFEVTGVGSCLLTDTGSNMSDLFEEDKEVVTYRTVDEAVEKVNYLLEHPAEAEQIAKAGQARALKDHTIMNRCLQIDEVIQKLL